MRWLFLLLIASSVSSFASPQNLTSEWINKDPIDSEARFIYQKINGKILRPGSPEYIQMTDLLKQDQKIAAAQFAAEDPGFVDSTARHFGSLMITNGKVPDLSLNDSLAMVMGAVRDNMDARELLTGNFSYGRDPRMGEGRPEIAANQIFQDMESQDRPLSMIIYPYVPQWKSSAKEVAGILSTRWWASVNYSAGTNRRVIPAVLDAFLCKPIEKWKRPNLPTFRIRQDIDRFPQQDASLFQTNCRSCHSAMDGFAGAFAKIDYAGERIVWATDVLPKYLRNSNVYPDGFITNDSSWINLIGEDISNSFGWSGPMSGTGIKQFGESLANSRAFGECMTKRVVSEVCGKDLSADNPMIESLSQQFVKQGYHLKDLFTAVVTDPSCRKSQRDSKE